ncbi:MAG: hypothetical protein IJT43_07980 [Stomatobaculum sp.]|nr:hypothetical protein [Stomatobaculum sp.]
MGRAKFKIPGLILLFLISLAVWFRLSPKGGPETSGVTYTVLSEPRIPVLWAQTCGRKMDVMHGYLLDTDADIAADTLIILPEDRKLTLEAEGNRLTITGIRYEIRTPDLTNLVERTELSTEVRRAENFSFVLPIQNLVRTGNEYRMDVILTTVEHGEIHYYSRIAFDETGRAPDMAELAESFSERNFDYNSARENTTYLETGDTGDNTTFGRVDLKSNFTQLTYGSLDLHPVGQADLRFLEYTGSVGVLQRNFVAEGGSGKELLRFEICENFVMRKGPERLYMMDYTRTMHEIFTGSDSSFEGDRIMLGVGEDSSVQAVASPEKAYIAFVSAGDLWVADAEKKRCVKVWSFRNGQNADIRGDFAKHGIRVFSCGDDGNVLFAVYGYMNRGNREGSRGISLLRYDAPKNTVAETAFLPYPGSWEELYSDVRMLSHLGENGMLYLKLGRAFCGIDTLSNEYIVISESLSEGNYAVSPSGSDVAWQDTDEVFGSPTVHFMNLETGTKKEITSGEGQVLKPIGFIGRDLVVGIAEKENIWILNGKERELPFSAIEIVDDALDSQAHYEEAGALIADVWSEESRIHLSKVVKTGENSFHASGTDTIVCNVKPEAAAAVPSEMTELREKSYVINLPKGLSRHAVRVSAPLSVSFENSAVLDFAENLKFRRRFGIYGHGAWLGSAETAGRAMEKAYGSMGLARYSGSMFYCRAATPSIRTLRNVDAHVSSLLAAKEDGSSLDLYGAPLRSVLYFVNKGYPVLGWTEDGAPQVIYAYDQTSVSVYDPGADSWNRMSQSEAEELFLRGRNDFSCLPK